MRRSIHSNSVPEVNTGKIRNLIEIAYELIYEEVKELTDGKDSTTPNEQAFYSTDYGKITHRQILKICQNTFRGEPGRIDVTVNNSRIQTRSLTFDKELIKKVGKTFEAITSIEIFENVDAKEEEESGATEQRNFDLYKEKEENEGVSRQEEQDIHIQRNDNNHANGNQTTEKSQDMSKDDGNNAETPKLPDNVNTKDDKNDVYTSIASNSVAPLQKKQLVNEEDTNAYHDDEGLLLKIDPSLANTTRFLSNLREEYVEYQCSTCQHKELLWKNIPRPSSCPNCKSLGFLSSTKSIFPVQDEAAFVERGGDNK
jgi:hypothetical protein